jgi:cytoskeletal protein CcmA (bactofilin family)
MLKILFGIVIALACTAQTFARTPAQLGGARTFGDDRFAAGGTVRVQRAVAGDLLSVGGTVDVDADVDGDAVVAGGNVRLGGSIGQSVYAAGGQVTVAALIGHNVRVAGGDVSLTRTAEISGNLSAAGGRVELNGAVHGYVQAAGGQIYLNGPVGGDVIATSGRIELGPQARIEGRLRYASGNKPTLDPAARVAGGIEPLPMRIRTIEAETVDRVGRGAAWVWTIGLIVLAAVLVATLPRFFARVSETARGRVGWSLLIGFIALVCIPVAAVILIVTLIGLPLGLLALLLYFPLLLIGYVAAGIALGDWTVSRWQPIAPTGWRIVAAMLAVLVIALAARVPVVGVLIVLAALLIGVGSLLMQWRRQSALPA